MTPKEAEAHDYYYTTPSEEFYKEVDDVDEVDETENWNKDDFGNVVYESDWVFVMWFWYYEDGKLTQIKKTGTLDGLGSALDEYGDVDFIREKLEIISGKEWLNKQ